MARKKRRFHVKKYNILNDIISREFTLQELRLFSIYLSQIDSNNSSTRVVRFPIKCFYRIMNVEPLKIDYLKDITGNLLTKIVCMQSPAGGYTQFQLFKKCKVEKDLYDQWYFEMDAHDDALPLMFHYKIKYFKYELWNILNLDSVNQFRMYEILKQFEWQGERIISVVELKSLLGIGEKEYAAFYDLKKRVLNACQKALKQKTDISFTYEPYARGGKGGKIQSLRFVIIKNEEYVNKINLEGFIDTKVIESIKQEPLPDIDISELCFIHEPLSDTDKLSILKAADNNISLIQTVYEIARQQGNIRDLTPWMIAMVKKCRNGEISEPVRVDAQNKNQFNNFKNRDIDFNQLELLELELLKEYMNNVE